MEERLSAQDGLGGQVQGGEEAWFAQHKRVTEREGKLKGGTGLKCKLEVTETTSQQKYATNEMRCQVRWKPFPVYAREQKMMHNSISDIDILQAWRQELMKPGAMTQKVGGQWLLGEYEGLLEEVVAGSSAEVTMSTERSLTNKSDLEQAMADAQHDLREHFQSELEGHIKGVGESHPESLVDDSWVRGAVGRDVFAACAMHKVARDFDTQAAIQEELQGLGAQDDIAASKYEKVKAVGTADKEIIKFTIEKRKAKVVGRVKCAADEHTPELEHIIHHIETKETPEESDNDLKNLLQQARTALSNLSEASMRRETIASTGGRPSGSDKLCGPTLVFRNAALVVLRG